jgi:hypothetical protein
VITWTTPLDVPSTSNKREHWGSKARRAKLHRDRARLMTRSVLGRGRRRLALPLVVTITRVSPRTLDDDNNVAALKAVRDGIADALGVDDADPRVSWLCAQDRGKPREKAVRVEIKEVSDE